MNFGSNNFGGNFQQRWNSGGNIKWLQTVVESQKIVIQNLNGVIGRLKAQIIQLGGVAS